MADRATGRDGDVPVGGQGDRRLLRRAIRVVPTAFGRGEHLWGGRPVSVTGRTLQVEAGGRDVAVIRLW